MPDKILIEQLDSFIEAMLSGSAPRNEPVRWRDVVSRLRFMPDENFKNRLKFALEGRTTMPQLATKPTSGSMQSVTPYITVANEDRLIEFLKKTFGAEELEHQSTSHRLLHEVRIGDSTLVVDRSGTGGTGAGLSALKIYVADCDEAYKAALDAGAVSLAAPASQPYGERSCIVRDEFGNIFGIASGLTGPPEKKKKGKVLPCLFPPKGRPYLDFLKDTFGAEETAFHESRGHLIHAAFRIGDTEFEMAALPRGWKRAHSAYVIIVANVDETRKRAMIAGATSVPWPAHRPDGGRDSALLDPAGYIWYPVTGPQGRWS
jgi:PhnB protein